jgi:5-phospho-D-xylono-1,4-lactonase
VNLQTVTGPIPVEAVKLADGHAHVWIDPPDGVAPDVRLDLNNFDAIRAELDDFRDAGGTTLIDCQPGGCGRDGTRLAEMARATRLHITATTGFHQRKYYPRRSWLWSASAEEATALFVEELTVGLRETGPGVRAAVIKVGYEGTIDGQTQVLMEAAAEAARQTGAPILFHTERGENAEALLPFFADRGVGPDRLYLCHVDKRPDVGLHRELAQAGVLLGYDTFARPKYDPNHGAWMLIAALVEQGLEQHIAVCLDFAIASMWHHYGGRPGMCVLPETIVPRLKAEGYTEATIHQLTAGNIARRLAW